MDNFRTVGHLEDGTKIRLNMIWDDESFYYIIFNNDSLKGITVESITLEENDHYNILEFNRVNMTGVEFTDINLGITILVDPCDEKTRNNISIYAVDKIDIDTDIKDIIAHKVQWCDIKPDVFDRNFFKVGHAYKIKIVSLGRLETHYEYALLISINDDYLDFAYVSKGGQLISSYTISDQVYKSCSNDWFIALDPDDHWSDNKEE